MQGSYLGGDRTGELDRTVFFAVTRVLRDREGKKRERGEEKGVVGWLFTHPQFVGGWKRNG